MPALPAVRTRRLVTGAWSSLGMLALRGLHLGREGREALHQRLMAWARCAEASLQLRLAFDPSHEKVAVSLLVEMTGADDRGATAQIHRALAEIHRVAGSAPGLELDVVTCHFELAGQLRRRSVHAVVASPGTMWEPHPQFLDELVDLALSHDAPCELSVTVGPDPARYDGAERELSARLAHVESALRGQRFVSEGQRWITRLPADLASLEAERETLEARSVWLQGQLRASTRCQITWFADADLDRTLLDATRRAFFGPKGTWREVTGDQAAELRAGPLDALACPGEVAFAAPTAVAAGLLQLPTDLPGQAERGPVPLPIPSELVRSAGLLLGRARGPMGPEPVRLSEAALDRHLWLCGQTGTGKSTLLLTLLEDAVAQGHGVGLIDPHGDLADALLERIGRRAVVFDLADPRCPGLDPLRHPDGPDRAIEEVTSLIFQLDSRLQIGPVFERYSRALLVLLMASDRGLADMSRVAHDPDLRRECIRRLDPSDLSQRACQRFWDDEFSSWSASYRGELQTYVVSKYDTLLRSSALRRLLDPRRPQLDVPSMLDEGKVFVARLSSARVGPVSSWFAGALLLSRLRSGVFDRVRQADRRPFTLAIDEFHTVLQGFALNDEERSLGPMLSEARKFGLRLVLANQHVAQLGRGTREAVLGNVGNLLMFRLAHRDATVLTEEMGMDLTPEQLSGLPNFRAFARLLNGGRSLAPFHIDTLAPER